MLLTDETGSATATLAYSAFGEPVGDAAALPTRYQFAGGHGYESGLLTLPGAPGTVPLTFQHLGARWYQPNTGRFIQRDPIGLAGGMNVYAYCGNNPTANVDPNGMLANPYPVWDWEEFWDLVGQGMVIGGITGGLTTPAGAGTGPGIVVGGVGGFVWYGGKYSSMYATACTSDLWKAIWDAQKKRVEADERARSSGVTFPPPLQPRPAQEHRVTTGRWVKGPGNEPFWIP